ncbi:MAG TPA: hypothetical protein VJ812_01180 [Gemmatimonadaceae bacterium]|nr:hypothetical protein [Gemmatimonadaceae bacterium]
MRNINKLAMLPIALLAIACAKDAPESSTELSADLRKELELASSAGLDLASAQATNGQQIVSPIEANQSAPVKRAVKPRRAAKPKASPIQEEQQAPEPELAVEPEPEPEAPVEVAAVAEAPVAAPRPSAPPVVRGGGADYPGAGAGDGGWGGIIPVIRGGSAGVDHCERHGIGRGRRGGLIDAAIGTGINIMVNNRGPRIGIANPTFPRR